MLPQFLIFECNFNLCLGHTRFHDSAVFFFVFSVYLFSLRDVMCYDRPGDVFVNMEGDTLAYNTQTLATGVVFFLVN